MGKVGNEKKKRTPGISARVEQGKSFHVRKELLQQGREPELKKARPVTSAKAMVLKTEPVARRESPSGLRTLLDSLKDDLKLAKMLAEKCELLEARVVNRRVFERAQQLRHHRLTMEALSGLLRLAGEALDHEEIQRLEGQLDDWMQSYPREVPALAWYCKGAIARHYDKNSLAQRWFHRYLREVRRSSDDAFDSLSGTREECVARGWVMLATLAHRRGHPRRARWIAQTLLPRVEESGLRTIPGILFLLLGTMDERSQQFERALFWYRKAHSAFLAEHNWYYHLNVLYAYARVARQQQNYSQAYWYLDLLDKACSGPEFGVFRREIASERSRLEQDAVDLRIDNRKGEIQTRDSGPISLRKQYVLLHILEALAVAHAREGSDEERSMTKAEIIERVWHERYRPEAHDNKLYYNINRLRKLLEKDMKNPQYLLNSKDGYRLAPGMKVHWARGVRSS